METGMGIALFSVWLWIAIISVYSQFGFWAIVIGGAVSVMVILEGGE